MRSSNRFSGLPRVHEIAFAAETAEAVRRILRNNTPN
jgi:hypothetical protein